LLFASNEGAFEAAVHTGGYQQRRLASWILFTTGAEYIVKGVCLEFGIGTMKPNRNTGEPDIGTLTPYFKGENPYLDQVAKAAGPPGAGPDLTAWCATLSSIRNREVHIFIKNVRGQRNFPLLGSGLLPLLNFLLDLHMRGVAKSRAI